VLGSFVLRALCARVGVHVRGFLLALHSVKGALGVLVYFIVLEHLDSDIWGCGSGRKTR
jgi:hypothetical protein